MLTLIYAYFSTLIVGFSRNKYVHHALILFLAFFFSTRNENVPDTENYVHGFTNAVSYISEGHGSIGMNYLNYLFCNVFHVSFSLFLFIVTFLCLEFWYFNINRLLPKAHFGILLVLFMSYFGFFYLGIALRNAIALMFCFCAITNYVCLRKHRALFFVLFVLIAISFHLTTITFLVFLPLLKINIKSHHISWLFLMSIVLAFFNNLSIVKNVLFLIGSYTNEFERYNVYVGDHTLGHLWNITFLMEVLITLVVLWGEKLVRKESRNLYLVMEKIVLFGFLVQCSLWTMPGITRLSRSFFFFSSVSLYLIIADNKWKLNNTEKYFNYTIISIAYFIVLTYTESGILNY